MKVIKNLLEMFVVCKKYSIIPIPFGRGRHIVWECDLFTKTFIQTNIFSDKFKEIFYHEIGHEIFKRKNYELSREFGYSKYPLRVNNGTRKLEGWLKEEAFASRFSRKINKKSCDVKFLVKCFQTYSRTAYSASHRLGVSCRSSELTDIVYTCIKSIEK